MGMEYNCVNCKHCDVFVTVEPCISCRYPTNKPTNWVYKIEVEE